MDNYINTRITRKKLVKKRQEKNISIRMENGKQHKEAYIQC